MQNVVEILTDYEARKRVGKTGNIVTEQLRDENRTPEIPLHTLLVVAVLSQADFLQQLQTVANKKQQLLNCLLHSTFWPLALARDRRLTSSGSVTIMPSLTAPSKTALRRYRLLCNSHSERPNGSDACMDDDLKLKMTWKQCVQGRVLSSGMWRHVVWYRRFGETYFLHVPCCSLGLPYGHER
jgi:hypothetical protein